MSVNLYNATTDTLKNVAGDIVNPKSVNEMIAPIEDGTASKAYAVGEQFIMNDLLCEATQPIAQGDTMVIGTNCEESEQLSKQVKDINNNLTANNQIFKATYQNGKYGFTINGTFYEIGGSIMPVLDFANPLFTFSTSNSTYTATKDCYLCGTMVNGSETDSTISINNTPIAFGISGANSGYIAPLKLKAGDTVRNTLACKRMHIFAER